jgi:probable HAF family extracellular repeat protein
MKNLIPVLVLSAVVLLTGSAYANDFGAKSTQQRNYYVANLSSLGGTVSRGNSINNLGWVTGYSNLAGNQSRHASLWLYGHQIDLGTLGGPNSSVVWNVKNNTGLIAGISQTAQPDPLGERWSCSAFFPPPNNVGYTCLGFVWEWGAMRALPTLGGNNGYASGANNRRQVVGWAENTVRDATCVPPQVLQFRPVVWGPGKNQIRQLPLIAGDTSGAATAINDRGQVVGISGTCDQAVGRRTARHAVLWENGRAIDLGDLGGDAWNTPTAINQNGDITGFAGSPNDPEGNFLRAFIWTKNGGMQSLGVLPGDVSSQANGINERQQIVGSSCDATGSCRAFLWENGVMRDLNALIAPGYNETLINAQDINDFGIITGRAVKSNTGELPAFVAIPLPGFPYASANALYSAAKVGEAIDSKVTIPERLKPEIMHPLRP